MAATSFPSLTFLASPFLTSPCLNQALLTGFSFGQVRIFATTLTQSCCLSFSHNQLKLVAGHFRTVRTLPLGLQGIDTAIFTETVGNSGLSPGLGSSLVLLGTRDTPLLVGRIAATDDTQTLSSQARSPGFGTVIVLLATDFTSQLGL